MFRRRRAPSPSPDLSQFVLLRRPRTLISLPIGDDNLSTASPSANEETRSSREVSARDGQEDIHGQLTANKHRLSPESLRQSRAGESRHRDRDDKSLFMSPSLRPGTVFVYMVIPPEGSYAWFITFISFLSQTIVDGIVLGGGGLLPHIAKDFNASSSQVVLVISLLVGFYFLSGATSSAFINKFGFRPVCLVGCSIAIVVLTISTFTQNLMTMIFFYSILGGPSLSMVWVSSQLVIGYYFDKHRPIANGVSCSGAGAGITIFSYMNYYLLPQIGWRNTIRLYATLLIIVFFISFSYVEVAPTRVGTLHNPYAGDDSDSSTSELEASVHVFPTRGSTSDTGVVLSLTSQLEQLLETYEPPTPENQKARCCSCCSSCCRRRQQDRRTSIGTQNVVIKKGVMDRQDAFYTGPNEYINDEDRERYESRTYIQQIANTKSVETQGNPDMVRATNYTISVMQVDHTAKRQRKSYRELKTTHKCPLCAYLSPKNWISSKISNTFRQLFDFRLLAIREFKILFAAAFLFPMGFNIPFVYSTARARVEATYAALITPTIGLSNFIFRILSGIIAYKYREYTTAICGIGMVTGGTAVFVSALYGQDLPWFQILYAAVYGMAPAFYSTLRAIIYVRTLGLEKLTNAFGLTAMAMGFGVFFGTTIGGLMYEFTKSFTLPFLFAGICIILSGTLKLILPLLKKKTL